MNTTGSEHTLHLHSPKIDKYTLQRAFLFLREGDEDEIYVTKTPTSKSSLGLRKEYVNLEVIDFDRFFRIENGNKKLRIVLDTSSICREARFNTNTFDLVVKLEEFINRLCEKRPTKCLCTYNVALLDSQMIKQLVDYHNKLLLTTNDVTLLSGDSTDRSELPKDSVEEIVKNNLETIFLALLQRSPMCGIDIMQEIHRDFNVFLSPGAVYPLLHTLNDRGLLRFKVIGKTKRYFPADGEAEEEIQNILEERLQVSKFLSGYLKHTMASGQGEEIGFTGESKPLQEKGQRLR